MEQQAIHEYPLVILGGGLAGLAASMRSKAPVFEASEHIGGVAHSDSVGEFVFDRGIHVLNTKSEKFLSFLRGLGIDMAPVNRIAYIYSHKIYTAYPFQVNTAGLPLGLRARCTWDFTRRESNPEPANYEQWMHRNLGRGFADTFLIPYSEKFWGVSPNEMTFEWTGTKVPVPSTLQVIRGALWSRQTAIGSNALFHYPQNGAGYGTIAEAMRGRGGEIHVGHRAISVDPVRRRITFDNGVTAAYRVLLSTIPLPALIGMISGAPSEVRDAAGRLRANRILVVNLGIARPGLSDKHWIHFPEKDISFFRISFPHNFSPRCAPAGSSSISVEVSVPPAAALDRDGITARVIADLKRVGVLRANDPIVATHTHEIPEAYCIYDMQRRGAVTTIKSWLDTQDIVPGGRFGLWTYFWSDEAINSGTNTALKALRKLGMETEELEDAGEEIV